MPRSARAALAFAATTMLLTAPAYLETFSGFAAYDDEGYFLVRLRDFVGGPESFSHVSAIYGPVYYELIGGFFKVTGFPITHDNGRYLTIAVWLAASVLQGVAAYRLTGRLWLGVGAQLVAFHVLAAMAPEPLHPSGLVALLIGGIVLAASFDEKRPGLSGAALGGLIAALCLIKINTGAFAVLALAIAWTASRRGRVHRWAYPAFGGIAVLLPAQLMWGQIGGEWVLQFAIVATASIVGLYLASLPEFLAGGRPPPLVPLVIGGVVVAAIGILLMYPSGWTVQDLLAALRQAAALPQVFVWPIRLNWLYPVWAVVGIGLLIAGGMNPRLGARVVVGAAAWVSVLLLPSALFLLILPLLWLINFRRTEFGHLRFARLLLAWIAVMEVLQAYPIAGMQLSMAALGLVPVGALLIDDGLHNRQAFDFRWRWFAPATVAVCVALVGLNAYLAATDYTVGVTTGLPGMSATRLPAAQGDALRATVQLANARCSAFITYPGLTSFYLWTGQALPVDLNDGPWMFIVDDSSQQAMVDALQAVPNLCVIEDRAMVDFWAQGRGVPDRPLVRYIESDFHVVGTFGDYQVLALTQ